jgi:AraC-like DNA-binding protein
MDFSLNYRPSDSPVVELLWNTRTDQAGTFISRAASHWEMVSWCYEGQNHITVRGPSTQAGPTDSPADAEFLGIPFKMGTYMPHLPINQLVNNEINLPAATGKAFWLQGAVWELPDFENVDTFVDRLIRQGVLVHDPVIEAALQGQPQDLSPRTLQYRFSRATGLTQKTIHQIERARQAASLLKQGISILDAAHEMGYFDQAHLTNSLKRFIGQTPAQLIPAKQPG